ncbi:unnamed protein product [Lymnaea stagnalis]|uniref:Schlafen AlbA-2 domain-containing protein n=1 Tax=Lymnaea stagnalis TaxID=6523 RepID=A0AAV2I6Y4_LYMST
MADPSKDQASDPAEQSSKRSHETAALPPAPESSARPTGRDSPTDPQSQARPPANPSPSPAPRDSPAPEEDLDDVFATDDDQDVEDIDEEDVVEPKFGIYVGPLRLNMNPDNTAKNIFRLLNCIGIRCAAVTEVSVHPDSGYAKVEFKAVAAEDHCVKVFSDIFSVMNVFDLRRLVDNPKHLKVRKITQEIVDCQQEYSEVSQLFVGAAKSKLPKPPRQKKTGPTPEPSDGPLLCNDTVSYTPVREGIITVMKGTPQGGDVEKLYDLVCLSLATEKVQFEILEEVDSEGGDEEGEEELYILGDWQTCIDTHTTLPQFRFCRGVSFYSNRDKMPQPEGCAVLLTYKEYQKSNLILAKYMSALLNMGKGGSIYFGVTDDGTIKGINLNASAEQSFRRSLDQQVNRVKPLVITAVYQCTISKIMSPNGLIVPDTKVIEIRVKAEPPPPCLYKVDGRPYFLNKNGVVTDKVK